MYPPGEKASVLGYDDGARAVHALQERHIRLEDVDREEEL